MKIKQTDVVAEYLREVDQRLAGLPVLQRRELLADLAAHIQTERAERGITTEGELIEVLERLGSPEDVAAAAHDEAGARPAQPPGRRFSPWVVAAVVAGAVLLLLLLATMFFVGSDSVPAPTQVPAPAHPMGPAGR